MITGIILAGGYSSRTHTNKMLLEFDNQPIIVHVIKSMQSSCQRIIVVTGHYHEEIKLALSQFTDVEVVQNYKYDLGMFSSVLCGVKEVKTDFYLVPGDYPLIQQRTYELLFEHHGAIRVPMFKGRRGHPIYIEKALIQELLKEPIDSNLKIFRDRHDVEYLETSDAGVIQDIDTLEDFDEMLKKKERVEIL